jgi:hypothetical protein
VVAVFSFSAGADGSGHDVGDPQQRFVASPSVVDAEPGASGQAVTDALRHGDVLAVQRVLSGFQEDAGDADVM